jgi:hypothetical protein
MTYILRTPIFAFAVLLILQAGNAAARVRGGLGQEYPAEVDQKESSKHYTPKRARKLDLARGGKTGRRTNAESFERELWGGGHGWNNWNHWGGGHKKHHWGHGWK